MFRRTSNNGLLTSRECNKKIVPLFSEMTRSKTLQAESVVHMEKNQTALAKLRLANDSFDYVCSASIDSSPSSEILPTIISQEKPCTRSSENTDEHFLRQATRNMLEHLQFTGSMVVGNAQKSPGGLPNGISSTISINEKKLLPIRGDLRSMMTQSDSDDSDSLTPEQTYAEYLRTHTLPQDPALPHLKNPPSASLLQGTAASLRRQSLASSLNRRISVAASPSNSLLQETSRHASICQSDLSSKQWTGRNSSSTISPTDAMLSRRRNSTGIATPSPLTSTSSSVSSSPTKEPLSCLSKQNNLASTGINCSSDTSVESTSSYNMFLTRTADGSSKVTHSTSARESRNKDYFRPPIHQGLRRSRKGFAMSKLDRSEFWLKVLIIAHAQSASEFVVSEHRDRMGEKEKLAASCIARLFLRRRAARFAIINFREEKVHHISRFFEKVMVPWRVRAATRRIEHFLVAGSVFRRPTMGFCASRVLRYLRSVRLIQHVFRCFLKVKRLQIASLEHVWDACEGTHISMVQDNYKDCMTVSRIVAVKVYPRRRSVTPSTDQISSFKRAPSSRRRNSAPGAAAIDCTAVYHHHHLQQQYQQQHQHLQIHLNAAYQDRDEDSGFRPKATLDEINATRHSENLLWQQRKWMAIETKFSTLITIEDKRRAERDTIIMYSITPEDKALLLHAIYKEARTKRIRKYDESLRLQQKAVEKNDVFTCADAADFLQCGDNGLVSMVKYKMRQVQLFVSSSNSKKRCMPFIFYRSSIDDNVVQHCMRNAHKENRTYELMYERYCRFH